MPYSTTHDTDDHDTAPAEILPSRAAHARTLAAGDEDWNPAPTGPIMPHAGPGGVTHPQHAYLASVFPPDVIRGLMGPEPLPTPRALIRTQNFLTHAGNSHLLPGAGVLTMVGLSAWAHSQPYHPLIGGAIITVGAWLVRSAVHAHKKHGADADPAFTKGLAGAGAAAVLVGTGATAGLSPWTALAAGAALWGAYGAAAALRHRRAATALRERREFAVALAAAGNTGPALAPLPPATPWGGNVSDEEYRLRKAFTGIKGEQVILGATRRAADGVWYVYADLSDTPLTADQVERQADKLAAAMSARRVEIERGDRPALVKVTVYDGEDLLEDTIPWDGRTAASILDPLQLGVFEDGTPVEVSLAWRHTLVCGTTDMGKSGVLNLVLCSTLPCRDVVRVLTDCKAGAPEFRAYRDVAFTVATNPEEGMRVLAGLEAVYRHRGELLVEKDVPAELDEDGETVQKWRPEFGPFILAAIDELGELTAKVQGAAERIQSLRAVMRFVGMFALDATQTPGRGVFGGTTSARLNYLNRISLATAEQGATNIIFGQGMHGRGWRPDLLDVPGQMYVYTPTNKRPRKARAFRVEPAAVARTVAAARGNVPAMDEGSADAFWEAYHAWEPEKASGGDGGPRGGGRRPEAPDSPAAGFGKPHLVVVPSYPDGSDIEERDVRLWQLLGEFGSSGTNRKELAAKAAARGHAYSSPSWVGGRLDFWQARDYIASEKEGREMRYWRTDLAVDERRNA